MESEYYAYDWDAPIRRIFTGVCDVVYQGAQHRLFPSRYTGKNIAKLQFYFGSYERLYLVLELAIIFVFL